MSVLLKLFALIRIRWNYTRLAKLCGLLQRQRQDSSIYLHSQFRPGAARFNHFIGKHRSKYEAPAAGKLICTSCLASCSSFLAAKLNSSAISDLFALINMWMKGEAAVRCTSSRKENEKKEKKKHVTQHVMKFLDWHLIFIQSETVCPCLPLGSANPDHAF